MWRDWFRRGRGISPEIWSRLSDDERNAAVLDGRASRDQRDELLASLSPQDDEDTRLEELVDAASITAEMEGEGSLFRRRLRNWRPSARLALVERLEDAVADGQISDVAALDVWHREVPWWWRYDHTVFRRFWRAYERRPRRGG